MENFWYGKHPFRWILWPIAFIYKLVTQLRRIIIERFYQQSFPIPLIVVGNLTVGGVGKTPLVIELAKQLQAKGLRVGVVSRGFGSKITQFPHEISLDEDANQVGDEPLLIAKQANCPVVIAPKRVQAVQYLLDQYNSQIVISDDGLQHYAMGRAIEIVVIDGLRQLGNGLCLPAGPLREDVSRLATSDFIVVNEGAWPGAHPMVLQPGELTHLATGQVVSINAVKGSIAAVAGIGHPQRFFNTLQHLGIEFKQYPFPDHHTFHQEELQFEEQSVIMTEKDAVKCQSFAENTWYFLPVEAKLSDSFWQSLWMHEQLQGYLIK